MRAVWDPGWPSGDRDGPLITDDRLPMLLTWLVIKQIKSYGYKFSSDLKPMQGISVLEYLVLCTDRT